MANLPNFNPNPWSFDSLNEEAGHLAELYAAAIKHEVACQLSDAMKSGNISKKQLAAKIGTSRSQLDRLLDPDNTSVHLLTMAKAARAVGKRLRIEMVDVV